jgi:hypothetical protein
MKKKNILFEIICTGTLMFLCYQNIDQQKQINELKIHLQEQELIEQTARYMISEKLTIH